MNIGRPWTKAETNLLKREYAHRSIDWLAERLNRHRRAIYCKAAVLMLRKSPKRLREMGTENVSVRHQKWRERNGRAS